MQQRYNAHVTGPADRMWATTRQCEYLCLTSNSDPDVQDAPKFLRVFNDALEQNLAMPTHESCTVPSICNMMHDQSSVNVTSIFQSLATFPHYIPLAPLSSGSRIIYENRGKSTLTLGFSLDTGDLEDKAIQKLAKRLPEVFQETGIPLRQIRWDGMRPIRPITLSTIVNIFFMIQKWKRLSRRDAPRTTSPRPNPKKRRFDLVADLLPSQNTSTPFRINYRGLGQT